LLADTYKFLQRFLVVDNAALVAGTSWVAHTHAFDDAEHT
jgi:hypothetical protein